MSRSHTRSYCLSTESHSKELPKIEDLVEYQELGEDKLKSVKGVNNADGDGSGWNWRGSGIIKIASSRWEILRWGGAKEGRR